MKMRSSKRQTKPTPKMTPKTVTKTTPKTKPKPKTKTKPKTKPSDLEPKQKPPAQNDEMDVEYEYDEMYGEDYEDEEEFEKPPLPEGFYEIEAVRKKRLRKGKKEYLVKWLGWPESGNSWEPVENLEAVTDLIKAYEESLKSGKGRSRKKGKRRNQNQNQNLDAGRALDLNIIEEPQVLSVHNSNFSNGTDNNAVGTAIVNQPNGTQSIMGSPPAEELKKTNELDLELSDARATSSTNKENKTELAIHIQEDVGTEAISPENGVCKNGEMVLTRVSERTGSKRRKTCAVKRFKQPTNSAPATEPVGKITDTTDVDGKNVIKKAVSVGTGLDADRFAATPQSPVIVKIVKPVNYTTFMENGIENVCVSLLVRRSDGEEVVVDNKYLKENNPVLLVNYYEKHLRYSIS